MSKQNLAFTLLLTVYLSISAPQALANAPGLVGALASGFVGVPTSRLQIKSGQAYDETKDPALRQGTENWEQSQESFFIIPGALIGIIGLFLFFNRDKPD